MFALSTTKGMKKTREAFDLIASRVFFVTFVVVNRDADSSSYSLG